MMGKVKVDIKMTELVGSFEYDFRTRSGETKRCLCIPEEYLYTDKKGCLWLNLVGYEDSKFGHSHSLKQRLSKTAYESLQPDGQGKRLTPYCGYVTPDGEPAAAVQETTGSQIEGAINIFGN